MLEFTEAEKKKLFERFKVKIDENGTVENTPEIFDFVKEKFKDRQTA